jgi:phytoene synthase
VRVARTPAHQAALAECRALIELHSKSFALATRLLPRHLRDSAAAVYAYCRRVDDAIDDCPVAQQESALRSLRSELSAIYRGERLEEAHLRAFQALITVHAIPQHYPSELLEGMAMDVRGASYETLDELIVYCHRVASVVGLMMCHVFGLTRESALEPARDLGIAMQLTNICRDVAEDHALGRVYLPGKLLEEAGCPHLVGDALAQPEARRAIRHVTRQLLASADGYYRSGARGIRALPFRAGLAVRVAAWLYRAIGVEVRRRACDPLGRRAVVSRRKKMALVLVALAVHVSTLPTYILERLRFGRGTRVPRCTLMHRPDQTPRLTLIQAGSSPAPAPAAPAPAPPTTLLHEASGTAAAR